MRLKKYLLIWMRTSALSLEATLIHKGASLMYLAGKFIRFFIFLWFLFRLGDQIEKVAGFSIGQLLTFFLVFNIFDMVGQIFFRGIYWFRQDVISGKFDLTLLKPMSTLFQIMTHNTDVLDVPLFLLVVGIVIKQGLAWPLSFWLLFGVVAVASIFLITAVHILVAALGILTTEVDHTIMIYRDFSTMARVPIDIYLRPIQVLLTVIVPVGLIMTFPAKALLGLLSFQNVLFCLLFTVVFVSVSLLFWRYAVRQYSSASS